MQCTVCISLRIILWKLGTVFGAFSLSLVFSDVRAAFSLPCYLFISLNWGQAFYVLCSLPRIHEEITPNVSNGKSTLNLPAHTQKLRKVKSFKNELLFVQYDDMYKSTAYSVLCWSCCSVTTALRRECICFIELLIIIFHRPLLTVSLLTVYYVLDMCFVLR